MTLSVAANLSADPAEITTSLVMPERIYLGEGDNLSSLPLSMQQILVNALLEGRVEDASAALGLPITIRGEVRMGRQLGRQLGFPTANVALGEHPTPRLGVYATRTRLPDGRQFDGVANIGENPTTGRVKARSEVWLFGFDEDIYGQTIETDLITFIRGETTFVDANGAFDIPALVAQVHKDAAEAKRLLTQRPDNALGMAVS